MTICVVCELQIETGVGESKEPSENRERDKEMGGGTKSGRWRRSQLRVRLARPQVRTFPSLWMVGAYAKGGSRCLLKPSYVTDAFTCHQVFCINLLFLSLGNITSNSAFSNPITLGRILCSPLAWTPREARTRLTRSAHASVSISSPSSLSSP